MLHLKHFAMDYKKTGLALVALHALYLVFGCWAELLCNISKSKALQETEKFRNV